MIIMDIKLDNILEFERFHLNMSYPKKIVNSFIEGEYLKDRPNFRYKKLMVLMGANASGKTTLGRALMGILNFINRQQAGNITRLIQHRARKSSFSIEYIVKEPVLYRVEGTVEYKSDGNYQMRVDTSYAEIRPGDSYEKTVERMRIVSPENENEYDKVMQAARNFGWNFKLTDTSGADKGNFQNKDREKVLEVVLKVLDPSIESVYKLTDVEESYVIHMKDQDIVVQNGQVIKESILSSGTMAGIEIAELVGAVMAGDNGFYYCDEKFSYIHSDIEKTILNILISNLGEYEQLFFTTHNTDVLDIPFPKHSFIFLKRDMEDGTVRALDAGDFLKRNTDSLRNAVENDLFSVAPTVDLLYELNKEML